MNVAEAALEVQRYWKPSGGNPAWTPETSRLALDRALASLQLTLKGDV